MLRNSIQDEIMSFLSSSAVLGAIIFASGAAVVALIVYFILRRFLVPHLADDTISFSGSTIVRMGTLYALILALVFAQEFADYTQIDNTTTREATAVGSVYHGLKKYDLQLTAPIRRTVAGYVQIVIGEEWNMLAQKKLSDNAWKLYRDVETKLLHLEPQGLFQKDLRSQMMLDWDIVGKSRIARLSSAAHELPDFLIAICIAGFFFVTVPYFAFSPKLANLFLITLQSAFVGLIIYFVLIIANPFSVPAPIEPTALEVLVDKDMASVLTDLKGG